MERWQDDEKKYFVAIYHLHTHTHTHKHSSLFQLRYLIPFTSGKRAILSEDEMQGINVGLAACLIGGAQLW